ncbi:hypothetical protein GAGA_4471 [Paraglaciecola agarilytica NO2]|uniref:Lipoprotein n=1 Tax=Paraglaciecola agarilytica NO2 TaxID=1125747 RepID=A0ABQ0ID28_9ALTE|nr:hypothetical protein GAGA_4471 [Paraglaciecola agarilytica NO2]
MNVRNYLVLGSLALIGCQSPVDDMLNNNFVMEERYQSISMR